MKRAGVLSPGPVVAAAVMLPEKFRHKVLNDSKRLTEAARDLLFAELTSHSGVQWAFAIVESEEIDRLNILRATHEAMRRAVAGLIEPPEHVLIDGLEVRPFPVPQTALVGGDALSFSIAAASVIAKVTRDRLMVEMDARYPQYGFARTKAMAPRSISPISEFMGLVRSIGNRLNPFSSRLSSSPEPGENPDLWLGRVGERPCERSSAKGRTTKFSTGTSARRTAAKSIWSAGIGPAACSPLSRSRHGKASLMERRARR